MKPILFNTEMVRAILEGRKTVTRRVVKFKDRKNPNWTGYIKDGLTLYNGTNEPCNVPAPYQVNDVLYVRETWCDDRKYTKDDTAGIYFYKADEKNSYNEKWRPSIHMPKEAARIFLRVTDVRVERLQDITEEQAKAEGISRLYDDIAKEVYEAWAKRIGKKETQEECSFKNYLWHGNFGVYGTGNKLSDAWYYQYSGYDNAVSSFSSLWNTTVKLEDWVKYGWEANPYVWVIEFERVDGSSINEVRQCYG